MNLTNEDIVGSLLPNVYISKITLQSTNDDKLIANVQLVLKETYGNDDISSWLEDSQVLKYLKIFIIQSAEADITKTVEDTFNDALKKNLFKNHNSFGSLRVDLLARGQLTQPKNLIYKEIDLFNYRNSEFSIDLPPSILELEKRGLAEKIVNDDATESYNIYLNVIFDNDLDENIEHLSYLYGSIYDLSSLLEEEGLDSEAITVGEISVETVIANSNVQQSTFIYTDENGNLWPGPIHIAVKDGKEYFRSGQTETGDSVDLTRVEVENNKVQDFRLIKRTLQDLTLEPINKNTAPFLSAFEQASFQQREFLNEISQPSISDGFVSMDFRKNSSVSFFIDLKKMFMDNSIYGQILADIGTTKSKSFIESYYKLGSLESIKLYSKRVDLDDSLSPNKQNEQLVAQYFGRTAIEEINRSVFLSDVNNTRMSQLHMFSIPDSVTKKEGLHEYIVEIEYKDNVAEYMARLISNLKQELNLFIAYYEQASSPAFYNYMTDRFIADPSINLISRTAAPIYDFRTYGTQFIQIFNAFFAFTRDYSQNLFSTISKCLNPVSGTPETISYVIKIYEQIIQAIQNTISTTETVNNSLNEKGVGLPLTGNGTTNTSKIIKITKNLNVNIDFQTDFIYEYLDYSRTDGTGLRTPTQFSYEVLKTDLILKKFNSHKTITAVANANKQNEIIYDSLSNIMSDLADLKITKKTTLLSNTDVIRQLATATPTINTSLLSDLSSINKLYEINLDDKKTLNTLLITLLNSTVDKSEQDVQFVFDASKTENIFWHIHPEKANAGDAGYIIDNLFDEYTISVAEAKMLPNQLKSLIKHKIDKPDVILGDAEVRFKYEMLKTVSFISGFEYDTDKEFFKLLNPIWKRLNGLSALQNTRDTRMLFCKLEDYSNERIGYKFNQALKDVCTNQYFFINNQRVYDNGLIKTGATQIESTRFELRCVKELRTFFDGQEQPPVDYLVDYQRALETDSYNNTKYSFLSPFGVQVDNKYRIINFHESALDLSQIPQDIVDNAAIKLSPRPLPEINLKDRFSTNDDVTVYAQSAKDKLNSQKLPEAIINKIANNNPASLSIYSRNNLIKVRYNGNR